MASIRKRGKSVQVQIRLLGVTDNGTFPNVTMAKLWAQKREAEIVAGARGLVVTGHTVAEAIDRFIRDICPTRKGERWEMLRLKLIRREWDAVGKGVDRVSSDDVARLRDLRLKAVKAPSVRREMVLLATLFDVAEKEWRWCASNPVRGVKKPAHGKPRKRLVLRHEYRALLRAGRYRPGHTPVTNTQHTLAAWCLALRTGMRAGELMKLEWRHVDLRSRVAELIDTKNGTDRTIPLFPRALRILEDIKRADPASNSDARVFPMLTNGTLDALYRKTRKAAGVVGLTFHDSRHTATTMLARRLSVLELARTIGHSDLNSLLIYYNESAASIAGRVTSGPSAARRVASTP